MPTLNQSRGQADVIVLTGLRQSGITPGGVQSRKKTPTKTEHYTPYVYEGNRWRSRPDHCQLELLLLFCACLLPVLPTGWLHMQEVYLWFSHECDSLMAEASYGSPSNQIPMTLQIQFPPPLCDACALVKNLRMKSSKWLGLTCGLAPTVGLTHSQRSRGIRYNQG